MIINGKKRKARDFYPTPPEFCASAVNLLGLWSSASRPHRILDAGAGTGNWGHAVHAVCPTAHLTGVDLPEVKPIPVYDAWYADYFEVWAAQYDGEPFDMVIGNPPYGDDVPEKWLRLIWSRLLKPGGRIFWLLRLNWYSSQGRFARLFSGELQPMMMWQSCRRLSFTGDGKTDDSDYAMYLWCKPGYGEVRPDHVMLKMFDYLEPQHEQLRLFEVV